MKSDPWQAELHETQWVTVREVPNSGKVTPQYAQSGGKPGRVRASEKSGLTNVDRRYLKTKKFTLNIKSKDIVDVFQ